MTRLVPVCASIAAVFALLAACSTDRIILASVETEQTDAGTIQQHAARCATTADCPSGTYCDRHDCSNPAGFCHTPPSFCPTKQDPSCGDDGVTYFNDCLRRVAGTSCSTDGECFDTAATCDSNGIGCLAPALCAQLGPFGDSSSCHPFGGHCWVLPATCPTDDDDNLWDECSSDVVDGGAPLTCQDTCSAIRSGHNFVRAQTCQ